MRAVVRIERVQPVLDPVMLEDEIARYREPARRAIVLDVLERHHPLLVHELESPLDDPGGVVVVVLDRFERLLGGRILAPDAVPLLRASGVHVGALQTREDRGVGLAGQGGLVIDRRGARGRPMGQDERKRSFGAGHLPPAGLDPDVVLGHCC